MNKMIYALMAFFVVGMVSVSAFICEGPSAVTGQVFDNAANPVVGATVTVDCNGNILTDTSGENGTYYVVYSCAECNYLDNVNVQASKDDMSGSADGQMCDAQQCYFPLGIVDVKIPEFGVVAGLVAMIGAIGIVAYKRKD